MKSILLSIKPKWVAKILNSEKTIEIRKTMPKCDLPINVYIYCTKDSKNKLCYVNYEPCGNKGYLTTKLDCEGEELNGKLVAKFTLRKVEEIEKFIYYKNDGWCGEEQEHIDTSKMCLSEDELHKYLNGKRGYAYHIEDLVIFDKPKELRQFYRFGKREYMKNYKPHPEVLKVYKKYGGLVQLMNLNCEANKWRLTKAPQNFCYVESEE